MDFYNGLNHSGSSVLNYIWITLGCILASDYFLELSPSVYWKIYRFNLMPPVPKFWIFLLMMAPFLCSTTYFMMVFPLLRVLQEIKHTSYQWRILPLEKTISYFILSPETLSWAFSLIAYPWRRHSIGLVFECLINNNHCIDFVFSYSDASSEYNCPTSAE